MFGHFKRLNQKMFTFLHKDTESSINNDNRNNKNNNKNNKDMDIIVVPGFYVELSTEKSERPNIIRVLGADTTKLDNWLTQDGKSIPSYIIEQDYKYLNLSHTPEPVKPINLGNIMGDFEEIEVPEKPIQRHQPPKQIILHHTAQNDVPILIQPGFQDVQIQKSPDKQQQYEIPFDIEVIEKLNIDRINEKNNDKFGQPKIYRKPIVNVSLSIELNYELSKVFQTIDLLDLDVDTVLNYIIEHSNIDIISIVKSEIFKQYENRNDPPKDVEKPIVELQIPKIKQIDISDNPTALLHIGNIPKIEPIPVIPAVDEKLNESIEEIDNFLTSYLFNND